MGFGTQDSLDDAKAFVSNHSMSKVRMLWDSGFDSWSHFGIRSQPAAVLLDRQGKPIRTWSGVIDEQAVLDEIDRL